MLERLHALAGGTALLTIMCFWISTLIAETLVGGTAVALVKSAIVGGLALLIPAMAVAGMTGALLARGRTDALIRGKRRRMRLLAVNGLLVMVPAALYLDHKAAAGLLDAPFYVVQGLELAVGAVQIAVVSRNIADGLRLSGRVDRGLGPLTSPKTIAAPPRSPGR
jgi:hypothetical protein